MTGAPAVGGGDVAPPPVGDARHRSGPPGTATCRPAASGRWGRRGTAPRASGVWRRRRGPRLGERRRGAGGQRRPPERQHQRRRATASAAPAALRRECGTGPPLQSPADVSRRLAAAAAASDRLRRLRGVSRSLTGSTPCAAPRARRRCWRCSPAWRWRLLSAAILPTVPSYDPWSWIVWGKEVTDPHLSFIVNGGPVVEAAAVPLHHDLRPVRQRRPDAVGDHGPDRRPARPVGRVEARQPAGRRRLARARSPALLAVIGDRAHRPRTGWFYYFLRGHLGGDADRRRGCGRSTACSTAASCRPILIGGRRRPDPARVVAVHRALRDLAVVPRARLPAARRCAWCSLAGLAAQPFGLVRPAVDRLPASPFLAATHAADYNGHLGPDVLSVDRGPRSPRLRCCRR